MIVMVIAQILIVSMLELLAQPKQMDNQTAC